MKKGIIAGTILVVGIGGYLTFSQIYVDDSKSSGETSVENVQPTSKDEALKIEKVETLEQWEAILKEAEIKNGSRNFYPYIEQLKETFKDNPEILEQLEYYAYSIELNEEIDRLIAEERQNTNITEQYNESLYQQILDKEELLDELIAKHELVEPPMPPTLVDYELLYGCQYGILIFLSAQNGYNDIMQFTLQQYDGAETGEFPTEQDVQAEREKNNEIRKLHLDIFPTEYLLMEEGLEVVTKHIEKIITNEFK